MGRVRRYKKVKNLVARRREKDDGRHDLDPVLDSDDEDPAAPKPKKAERRPSEPEGPSKKRRRQQQSVEPSFQELQQMLDADVKLAKRVHSLSGPSKQSKKKAQAIEGKRPEESMKQFKARIDQEKKRQLAEGAKNASTTFAKKKQYLTERREKKDQLKKRKRGEADGEEMSFADEAEFARRPMQSVGITRVADRPPEFAAKPRGADKIAKSKKKSVTPARALELQKLREQVTSKYREMKAAQYAKNEDLFNKK